MIDKNIENYIISVEKSLLNKKVICDHLSNHCYWALGRSEEKILKSIETSICFGVYDSQMHQVGFARVVTDECIFAWIHDVFILPSNRGIGLSKKLMTAIKEHPSLQNLQRWGLNTKDAHSLYEQFGFTKLKETEAGMMEITARPS